MSGPGPATWWATHASNGEISSGASRLDHEAIRAAPAYASVAMEHSRDLGAAMDASRRAAIAELAERDPSAAAEVGRSPGRNAALLFGVLTSCFAGAVHLGRADFDPVDILPLLTCLIWVTAVLISLGMLPLRRRAHPTVGLVLRLWTALVLCTVGLAMNTGILVFAGYAHLLGILSLVALAGLLLLAGVVIAATVVMLSRPAEDRDATVRRLAEFERSQGAAEAALLDEALGRLQVAWEALDPGLRTAIERDLDEAHGLLERRGFDLPRSAFPGAQGLEGAARAQSRLLEQALAARTP